MFFFQTELQIKEFTLDGFLETVAFPVKEKDALVKEYSSALANRLTEKYITTFSTIPSDFAVPALGVLGIKEEHVDLFVDAAKRWQERKGE